LELHRIQEIAQWLQRDLGYHAPRMARAIPGYGRRFGPSLKVYPKPYLVKNLKTDAAFKLARSGQLIFNAAGVRLFHQPIDEKEACGALAPDMADVARQIAVEQLIVHELDHVSTGLIRFSDVQALKAIAGSNALGEIDLRADISGAQICARLEMFRAQERGAANYATRLQQQLFVMGTYAFPAFQAPADKSHKRQRFLGLAMTAARIHGFLSRGAKLEPGELPIDVAIYPQIDVSRGRILLFAYYPERFIWGHTTEVDPAFLAATCNGLDSEPFARSVGRAARILREIGPITNPVAASSTQAVASG
jgi:hypothetical protein